jgi:hypothetical protein
MSAAVRRLSAWVVRASGERELIYETYDWGDPPALRYDSITANPPPDPNTATSGGLSGILLLDPSDTLEWECEIDNSTDQVLPFGITGVYEGVTCDLTGFHARGGETWRCEQPTPEPEPEPDAGAPDAAAAGGTTSTGSGGGGAAAAGGSSSGGSRSASGGSMNDADTGMTSSGSDDGGCGCRTPASSRATRSPSYLAGLALGLVAWRRARRRARTTRLDRRSVSRAR